MIFCNAGGDRRRLCGGVRRGSRPWLGLEIEDGFEDEELTMWKEIVGARTLLNPYICKAVFYKDALKIYKFLKDIL